MSKFTLIVKLLFSIFIISFIIGMLAPQLLSINLKKYDEQKYSVAYKISKHKSFTKGDVHFYICYNLPSLLMGAHTLPFLYPHSVFLSPDIIYTNFFDAVIAHELGHLEYRHSLFISAERIQQTQKEADTFAANIVGQERLKAVRLSQGFSKDHYLVKNLEN